ncbi:S1 family peptidase [Chitinophaga sancti]|uniref:Serine protease n=1 Tax=Chitinophaga sancti TaxID=1004 RepID=A0A1K1SJL2_9BACT|nr:serine protease [Chitinophaga sancti]WQD64501.1 serine protease [Chitinophaga sancti]WQG89875.1 serine protease [Chitinophaga sancti]SFW84537.1 Trypsin-like peptidase domain-containing protein [Chitinophaga sancti]
MFRKWVLLAMLVGSGHTLLAQDTIQFRDDDQFTKLVYNNVREDMKGGGVKGFRQLWAESVNVLPSQKVSVKYTQAKEKKPMTPVALAKQLHEQVFVIWKFFRKTETNIEGISIAATAFPINEDGTMVTNQHVFEVLLKKTPEFYEMDSTLFLSDVNGNVFSIDKILSCDENADLALFTIKNVHAVKIHPLALGNDAPVGTPVYLLSHPEGFPYYFSSGQVARNAKYGEFGAYTERMDITADYAIGSSGGPIVNEFGALIGVVSSTHSIYGKQRQEMQMVVKQTIPVRSIYSIMTK